MGDSASLFSSDCYESLRQHPFPASTDTPLVQLPGLTVPSYSKILEHENWVELEESLAFGTLLDEPDLQSVLQPILASMSTYLPELQRRVMIKGPINFRSVYKISGEEWESRLEVKAPRRQLNALAAARDAMKREQEAATASASGKQSPKAAKAKKAKTPEVTRTLRSAGVTHAATTAPRKRPRTSDTVSAPESKRRAVSTPPVANTKKTRSTASSAKFDHFFPDLAAIIGAGQPYHISFIGELKFDKGDLIENTHREGVYQMLFYIRIARGYSGARLGILFYNGYFQRFVVLDDDSIAIESDAWETFLPVPVLGDTSHVTPTIGADDLKNHATFWRASLPNALVEDSKYLKRSRDRLIHFMAVALYIGAQQQNSDPPSSTVEPELQAIPVRSDSARRRKNDTESEDDGEDDAESEATSGKRSKEGRGDEKEDGAEDEDSGESEGGREDGDDGGSQDGGEDGDGGESQDHNEDGAADNQGAKGDDHDGQGGSDTRGLLGVGAWLAATLPTLEPHLPPDTSTNIVDVDPDLDSLDDAEMLSLQKCISNSRICVVLPWELDRLVANLSMGRPVTLEAVADPDLTSESSDNDAVGGLLQVSSRYMEAATLRRGSELGNRDTIGRSLLPTTALRPCIV